ncbi:MULTISPECIES: ATP-binding protein [Leptolyngbya]|uniref:ATP-binding protein n=1 Tax=Leptolyngbya TaxID=47251 RepID=UPI0016874397|nr:ATP-binding protein [Leptolyngbya sp. FACHB-1624]MBD1854077.1 ATP-binding protein [Leptolyngbya sp. FACHB-1624]
MSQPKLTKRVSTALVNALSAGVVPRVGLEHIAVGREKEIAAIRQDFEHVANGGAAFRFVIGRYGAGKSFTLQLIRNLAMEQGFVVADADITPDRRLVGSQGAGVATYRELMRNLATKSRPEGGALTLILERWIAAIQAQVAQDTGMKPSDEGFDQQVEAQIRLVTQDVADLVNGFDFATVIIAYWTGYRSNDEAKKESAMRWLRGEFSTKTEAKAALGVRVIIDDDSWYDYVKLIARFAADIDYKGLIIILDEVIHLSKISTAIARQNNYDKLLAMFNDAMQGKVSHLGTLIGGTPQFLEDPRRGLYSDPAWQRRTAESRVIQSDEADTSAPVIRLEALSEPELQLLLQRISIVFFNHYEMRKQLTASEISTFISAVRGGKIGTETRLTPGEIIRDFMTALNLMQQNPNLTLSELIQTQKYQTPPTSTEQDEFAEFTL